MSEAMESLYQQLILDHYKTPSHKGFTPGSDQEVEVHHVNPTCGDEVTMRVRLDGADEGAVISDISWEGDGCSISQASTSIMTDLVAGHSVNHALDLAEGFRTVLTARGEQELDEDVFEDAIAFNGVAKYPARVKCALLGWLAMKDAVSRTIEGTDHQQSAGEEVR